MHYDYYLGFDSYKLKHSMSYVMKLSLIRQMNKFNKTYTFNLSDDFDEAIACSAEEMFRIAPSVLKRNKTLKLVACSDLDDFKATGKDKKKVLLSQDCYINYPKADQLFLHFQSQVDFMKSQGIENNYRVFKPIPTFSPDQVIPENERNSFRRFYQIPENKELIITYGSYYDVNMVETLSSIVRNNPQSEFIFFGKGNRDAFNKHVLERTIIIDNIRYVESIPEELYHSMLKSVDALLLIGDYISYPQILIDLIYHKVPVISFTNCNFYPEILNEDTVLKPKDMASAFRCLLTYKENNKTEKAYETIKSME